MLRSKKNKPKREIAPWRVGIISHHRRKPSRKSRSEFPAKVVKELRAEAAGLCRNCASARDTTTHHVMPRSRGGRGVKTNGLRLCDPCHDMIQRNEAELQRWINIFKQKYGPYFWYDDLDWELHRQRGAELDDK